MNGGGADRGALAGSRRLRLELPQEPGQLGPQLLDAPLLFRVLQLAIGRKGFVSLDDRDRTRQDQRADIAKYGPPVNQPPQPAERPGEALMSTATLPT